MTTKPSIPDRFIGYAFSVGDLLVELDTSLKVTHLDGATGTLLGPDSGLSKGVVLTDLLSDSQAGSIKRLLARIGTVGRVGPVPLQIGQDPLARSEVAAFLSRLPSHPGRYFLVLSAANRMDYATHKTHLTNSKESEQFLENLAEAYTKNPDIADEYVLTLVEADADIAGDPLARQHLETRLKEMSAGGKQAAEISGGKFAMLQEKSKTSDLVQDIMNATGIQVESADLDTATSLQGKDSVEALIFSLREYAKGAAGFELQSLQSGCSKLVCETTEKMKEFRAMMETDSFSLVYQPIVDLTSGKTHHYEALSRFDNLKNMEQFEAICFAEETGLIKDFDRAVLAKAISKILTMEMQGGMGRLAINLSGRSLSDPDFVTVLQDILHDAKGISSNLSLEITESARIDNLTELANQLETIRSMGFKVFLDDFGAGAAGFQYLKELNVDALKIDGAYIRNAIKDPKDRAFLRSMVMLCHDLGLQTVGEWVETKAHAELLENIGVNFGQGYFYGRPIPVMKTA